MVDKNIDFWLGFEAGMERESARRIYERKEALKSS